MPGNGPCMRRNDNTGARRPKAPKVDDVVRHLTQRILKARAGWRGHARPPDSCVAASHSWWPCCDVHRGSPHTTEPRGASREETTNCVRVHPDVPMGDDNPVGQHLVRYVGPVSQYFPRRPSLTRDRDGVHGRQRSRRLLSTPRNSLLAYRHWVPGFKLAREVGSLLDHVRGGYSGPFCCSSTGDRPRVSDWTLGEGCVQCSSFRIGIRGVLNV